MPSIAVLGDRDLSHRTHRELDAELARMPAGVEAAWLPSPRAAEAAENPLAMLRLALALNLHITGGATSRRRLIKRY